MFVSIVPNNLPHKGSNNSCPVLLDFHFIIYHKALEVCQLTSVRITRGVRLSIQE